jgi:hypothetical protein
MLIRLQEDTEEMGSFPSPIAGSSRAGGHNGRGEQYRAPLEHTPTSADVHLYGGENPPVGALERRSSHSTHEISARRLTPARLRRLAWADTTTKRTTRAYIVKELYPRLLYTLSDVVVFVIRDANSKYEARSQIRYTDSSQA